MEGKLQDPANYSFPLFAPRPKASLHVSDESIFVKLIAKFAKGPSESGLRSRVCFFHTKPRCQPLLLN